LHFHISRDDYQYPHVPVKAQGGPLSPSTVFCPLLSMDTTEN